MSEGKHIGVGTGVFIRRDGKVLLGKRKNANGAGQWSPPGGHVEFGETWSACAAREVMEETGLTVGNIKFVTAVDDITPEWGTHYVTIIQIADYIDGEAVNVEPHKCEGWEWFDWDNLPTPMFTPAKSAIDLGFNPFA